MASGLNWQVPEFADALNSGGASLRENSEDIPTPSAVRREDLEKPAPVRERRPAPTGASKKRRSKESSPSRDPRRKPTAPVLDEIDRGVVAISKVLEETLEEWLGFKGQAFPPEIVFSLLENLGSRVILRGYPNGDTDGIEYRRGEFVISEELELAMERFFDTTPGSRDSLEGTEASEVHKNNLANKASGRIRSSSATRNRGVRSNRRNRREKSKNETLSPIDNREERLELLSSAAWDKRRIRSLDKFDLQIPGEYLNYPYEMVIDNPNIPESTRRDIERFIEESLVQRDAINSLRYQFMVVYGSRNGSGKTTLGTAIAREIVSRTGSSAMFIQAADLMARASFDYDELISEIDSSRVLVIDDLGVTSKDMTQRQEDTLFKIIDSRWGDPDKVTIITTNLRPIGTATTKGLSDYFGKAAWSRVGDKILMIEMNQGSYRGAGRKASKKKLDEE